MIQQWYCKEKFDTYHSKGVKRVKYSINDNHGLCISWTSWKMHVQLLFISQSGIFTFQPAHQNLHKYNSALHSILLWWTHISPPFSEKTSLSDDINKVWAPSRVITTPSWTSEKYNNLLGYTHHDNIQRLYIRKSSIGLIQAVI